MNDPKLQVTGRVLAISDAVRKRNPELFGLVRPVEASIPKQPPLRPLVKGVKKFKKGKGSVAVRVTIISLRKRLLDRDAIAYSCKAITDSIAQSLEVDDDDERVEWEWQQVKTAGAEGVVVKIELIPL